MIELILKLKFLIHSRSFYWIGLWLYRMRRWTVIRPWASTWKAIHWHWGGSLRPTLEIIGVKRGTVLEGIIPSTSPSMWSVSYFNHDNKYQAGISSFFVFWTSNGVYETGAPECGFNGPRVHYVEVGESVKLTCDVTAHPMPNVHHWALKRSGHLRGLNVNDSSMVYNMWSITDYGIIQCRASNDAGIQESPCLFLLKPPG